MIENKNQQNEGQMSFLEHLEELRWRLVRSAIAVVCIGIVIWIFQEWIMENVFMTMKSNDFISFRLMCKWFGTCVEDIHIKDYEFNFTSLMKTSVPMSELKFLTTFNEYKFIRA